jgi:hypothetical protein
MSFGLRNAGATYQRCMQHVFGDHIGRTIEAYIDDVVVKTRKADDLVNDLRIAVGCLRANGVKLNPEYIVSQRGIEANPEKVAALEWMGPIWDLKGVQRVLGCLAALSRFISRLDEKGLPLYRLLKKHERFSWTVVAQEVLDKLKASQSSHRRKTASLYTSTWPQPPKWSALSSWWSARRRGTLCQFSGRCTTSVKSCLKPRRATRKSRSCFTQLFSHDANSATTSRLTRSRWFPPFR